MKKQYLSLKNNYLKCSGMVKTMLSGTPCKIVAWKNNVTPCRKE